MVSCASHNIQAVSWFVIISGAMIILLVIVGVMHTQRTKSATEPLPKERGIKVFKRPAEFWLNGEQREKGNGYSLEQRSGG